MSEQFLLKIAIVRLPHGKNFPLPAYATQGSAGMDLYAAIEAPIVINPSQRHVFPTGVSIAVPLGWEAQIRSRSGLARNHGVKVLQGVGTIDSDYRGEVQVLLLNTSELPFEVTPGMRIAQMVVARYERVQWQEEQSLENAGTEREGGWGSTGLS